MAEVHVIGQLVGARDFPRQNLFCRWTLQCGNNWKIISGNYEGQTQVVCSEFDDVCRWSFPIDIHLVSTGIPGWPKIYIQVYYLDWFDRTHLFGYGFVSIPTSPGNHMLNCYTWRPFGTIRERFTQYFLGGGPRIKYPDLIFSSNDRYKLNTEAMGVVLFEMATRFFIIITIIETVILFNKVVHVTSSTQVNNIIDGAFESAGCDFVNVTCEEYNTSTTSSNESETESNYTLETTTIPLFFNISKESRRTYLKNEICTCDLQKSSCDINCCCDEDCTDEKRLIFDHCEMEPNRIYDTRYCKYVMLSYKNNTPYEWQVNQNSLFCIVKNNLPNEYSLHKEVEIFSDDDAKFQKINKYSWNSMQSVKRIPFMGNNSYFHYGDYVWIVENTTLKILEIPMNFEGTAILISKKAKYLQDIKVTCIQTNVHPHNKLLDINTFIMNVTVLSLPKSVSIHRLEECPKNICISIEARICNEMLEHCRNITKPYNASTYKLNCNMKGNHSEYSCYNIVKRLRYIIFHNAEKGIVKVEILFFLGNLRLDSLKTVYALQEFEVQYAWINVTAKYNLLRSGNPGYIVGKPIMIGQIAKYTDAEKKKEKNLIITRNSIDLANNFLVLPQRKDDICVLNNNRNTIIKFGYNIISTCKIIDFLNVTNTTAKRHCQEIQKAIFKLWSVTEPYQNITKVYAKYGNADVNKIDEWGNITYSLNPKTLLSNITGNFLLNNLKIDCQHLSNVIKIEIFHARQVVKTLHNQEKIVWLMISFENKHNQSFLISDNRISLKSQLRSEIMFYDVTTKKNKHYLEPPTFDIKIPHDLFYPFVKVKNGSNKLISSYLLRAVICFLLYYEF